MKNNVIYPANILLPAEGIDLSRWAVVAVDQFTSEPEYWQATEKTVSDAPSALRLVLPEIYLNESDTRIPAMQSAMRDYLSRGVLSEQVHAGYVLVERETSAGARIGLIACLDLEQYDYAVGSQSLIRATEGTVLERVPPRVRMRRGAALELPHVLMLLDDPNMTTIEPLYARRNSFFPLYDFELMQQGGRVRGWRVDGEAAQQLEAQLDALYDGCDGLFLAVGDGNHSLAAARSYWLELRQTLSEAERRTHPARFALAEIENLHSPAIAFEPIHRLITGVQPAELIRDYEAHLRESGLPLRAGRDLTLLFNGEERGYGFDVHPLRDLQTFLDAWLAGHSEASIDYIHGDDALRRLANRNDAVGIMPCGFAKADLFPYIRKWGVLPRKTFSMGHAREKRYYLEARRIEK